MNGKRCILQQCNKKIIHLSFFYQNNKDIKVIFCDEGIHRPQVFSYSNVFVSLSDLVAAPVRLQICGNLVSSAPLSQNTAPLLDRLFPMGLYSEHGQAHAWM